MAYIDLITAQAPAAGSIGATLVGTLDRREWEVVRLARNDGLQSLGEPGRMARLVSWAFGFDVHRRLADPRLEALRRFAVMAWRYGYALPVSAIKDFKAAGFSMDQLEIVLARIANARVEPRRRAAG